MHVVGVWRGSRVWLPTLTISTIVDSSIPDDVRNSQSVTVSEKPVRVSVAVFSGGRDVNSQSSRVVTTGNATHGTITADVEDVEGSGELFGGSLCDILDLSETANVHGVVSPSSRTVRIVRKMQTCSQ